MKLILQTQQRFKCERHNVFTEEINKIALISNDDKRMESIGSIETYACGTSKYLVSEKEVIKCNNKTIQKCYKKKKEKKIIQIGSKFLIIHTEY